MLFDIHNIFITHSTDESKKVADILCEELKIRSNAVATVCNIGNQINTIDLSISDNNKSESFSIKETDNGITISAHRLRGLIYGIGKLLRNISFSEDVIEILDDAFGDFTPDMPVRGHGIGYTGMSNSYEAWDKNQIRRYIIELMYFGLNTVETSYSQDEVRTELMKYSFDEVFYTISSVCKELDLDFTFYYALTKRRSDEETIDNIIKVIGKLPKVSSLFLPGGDPGDMLPEAFVERCKVIKEALIPYFPEIELWPSAQAPHEYPDWRERFTKVMSEKPDFIDGIIYAPNHAMPIDDLRRTMDKRYPLWHYPDISHNVRCETPVNFTKDNWHFAWASTLSRESVNPRPLEYKTLHKKMRQYTEGQVSYSEGVHDDINKAVWSGLDFSFDANVKDLLKEYSRLYFPKIDENTIAEGILGLEQNWSCDPIDSATVEPTYSLFKNLSEINPKLNDNWRFGLLLFRATCDKIVRDRRIFELSLVKKAEREILKNNIAQAKHILETNYSESYKGMRSSLYSMAEKLFSQIGIQLDVDNFKGMSWERGCTLETIDMPITDKQYLLNRMNDGLSCDEMKKIISRGKVGKDEYYFSFAQDGFDICGTQEGEFYFDFKGDQNKDAKIPMCMLRNYDHFEFKTKVAGLVNGDYIFRVTYKNRNQEKIKHHRIEINGNVLYDGPEFGGTRDKDFESLYIPDGYQSIVYTIPNSWIENGCIDLKITEPEIGFIITDFWFTKK